MRSSTNRAIAAALAGGLALASVGATSASAAPRHRVVTHHRGVNGAAAFGAFAALAGTFAAIAAANNRNDYYYGGGPYYAAPAPYYGYGGYGYNPGWRGSAWGHRWHR